MHLPTGQTDTPLNLNQTEGPIKPGVSEAIGVSPDPAYAGALWADGSRSVKNPGQATPKPGKPRG